MPSAEDRLTRWLRRRAGTSRVGDDAAILPAGGPWAVTVDTQIAGTHVPPDLDPSLLARRLLAVNLSDLAAMGAEPCWAFLALAVPAGFDHRRFFESLLSACAEHGIELAGGDLAASPVAIAALTLAGRLPAGGRWLRRGDARPGDGLWLGGPIGESATGARLLAAGARLSRGRVILPPALPPLSRALRAAARRAVRRHLLPEPQLALGRALGRRRRVAAIDLSDGLARDLHRLCHESGTGAVIDASRLPLPADVARILTGLGADPLMTALAGGEDYVLLFTLPAGAAPPPGSGCHPIGTLTARRGLRYRHEGRTLPLPDVGWDHLERGCPDLT